MAWSAVTIDPATLPPKPIYPPRRPLTPTGRIRAPKKLPLNDHAFRLITVFAGICEHQREARSVLCVHEGSLGDFLRHNPAARAAWIEGKAVARRTEQGQGALIAFRGAAHGFVLGLLPQSGKCVQTCHPTFIGDRSRPPQANLSAREYVREGYFDLVFYQ